METMGSYGTIGKVIFIITSLVVLYYFYKYLFASTGLQGLILKNGTMPANPTTALKVVNDLPALYEGGEYSVNIWIYINDWSVRRGYNKHIISLGGAGFLTFAMYLKPYVNALGITVRTTDMTNLSSGTANQKFSPGDSLATESLPTLFNSLQGSPGGILTDPPCDIPSVDLQKWVQVTLTLNNKTSDVYIDGKLARSCILPSFYRVDRNNLTLSICDWGGFGGYVSNASAYNYTLNPEEVWKLYMKGPGPTYSITDYWNALFNPNSEIQTGYPKMNVVG